MPYIRQTRREAAKVKPESAGELTYKLTMACVDYLGQTYDYADLAIVLGAIEATKLEFYRRVVAPYESEKCDINGNVYPDRAVVRLVDNSNSPGEGVPGR